MKLDANQLALWCEGSLNQNTDVTGVKVDQRLITKGDLFVCLIGDRVDGHQYAQAAVDQGASCLLVDRYLDIDIPQIKVQDTYQALIQIGEGYRNSLDVFIIGVTGSNGKTSTKDILHSILNDSIATHMNQNTVIGTILNIFRMDESTKYGIFELGLDGPGDISAISTFLKPDAGIITSLAPAHMANFKDLAHIAQEKFRLFDDVKNQDLCFYQGDFPEYRKLATHHHSFGFNDDNEYVVGNVKHTNTGISFEFLNDTYECNLLGTHQASNAAGIISLLKAIGIDNETIKKGLKKVALTSLRTEIVEKNKSLVLLDAYKSNRSSLVYALDILKQYDYEGPKVAFLSDMVELGEISVDEHLAVLNKIEELNLDHVYTLGDEFKKAFSQSDIADTRFSNTNDFETFKNEFDQVTQSAHMILIKGSRSYALERLMKE